MRELKQSTAANVMVLMSDSTDHVSGKAGLTLTITASKDGAAFASITPTVTERGSGWYNVALTTTHTDTLGDLAIHITGTGADPSDLVAQVVANLEADTYSRIGAAGAGLTAIGDTRIANLDAAVSGRMASYTQPSGFLAATFPATVASPTNITAGVITTATNVTNVNGLAAGVITAASIASDAITAAKIASDADTEIASAVWDLATSGHTTSGSFGQAMNAAGSAGDPWTTSLPGSYSSGQAGYIVGNNLDAVVSTRLATSGYTAPDNSDIVAIKAKTDNLPASPAAVGSAMTLTSAYDPAKTAAQASTALTTATWTNILAGYLDAAISTRSTYAGGAVASVTAPVTAGTVSDKTGYSLASTGLDTISVTAPTGVATTFPKMVVQLWRRFFAKSTMTASSLVTYASDGTTVVTTQAVSDDGTTQTQGAAT